MKKEIMTIHDVRSRIDWCHERITEINAHILSNSNMLDSEDISSMRVIWQYLGELRTSKWTNQLL